MNLVAAHVVRVSTVCATVVSISLVSWFHNVGLGHLLKVFPIDVLSHYIVQRVPVGALFAVVHRLFHTVPASLQQPVLHHDPTSSRHTTGALPHSVIGHVEKFNVCFQSLFVAIVSAVGAVEQNVVFKVLAVYIAEMAFVRREVLG